MAGAVRVLAGEGGREGMFVSDMVVERWVQAVGVLVQKAMRDKGGELVCGVQVRAKE